MWQVLSLRAVSETAACAFLSSSTLFPKQRALLNSILMQHNEMAPNYSEVFEQFCEPDCFLVKSLISRGREKARNREYKHRIVSRVLRYTIRFQKKECLDIENGLISFHIQHFWQLTVVVFVIFLVFTFCNHKFELDLSSVVSLSLEYVLIFFFSYGQLSVFEQLTQN